MSTTTTEDAFVVPDDLAQYYVEPPAEQVVGRLQLRSKYGTWEPMTNDPTAWDDLYPEPSYESALAVERAKALGQARLAKARADEGARLNPVFVCRVCGDTHQVPMRWPLAGATRVCVDCGRDLRDRDRQRYLSEGEYAAKLDAILDGLPSRP